MATFSEITRNHPCFAQGAKSNKGRIHLPVSPGCNIACKFCKREFSGTEVGLSDQKGQKLAKMGAEK